MKQVSSEAHRPGEELCGPKLNQCQLNISVRDAALDFGCFELGKLIAENGRANEGKLDVLPERFWADRSYTILNAFLIVPRSFIILSCNSVMA